MVAMDVDWIEAGAPTYQETDGKWVRVITVRKMGQWRVSLTQEMVSLYCCMIQADLMTSKVEKKNTHTHTLGKLEKFLLYILQSYLPQSPNMADGGKRLVDGKNIL